MRRFIVALWVYMSPVDRVVVTGTVIGYSVAIVWLLWELVS